MKSEFSQALASWPSQTFNDTIKSALLSLPGKNLPLDQFTNLTGFIDDKSIGYSILSSMETESHLQVKIGVFFKELLAGCNCSEDPQPIDSYAELLLLINKQTADYEFRGLA